MKFSLFLYGLVRCICFPCGYVYCRLKFVCCGVHGTYCTRTQGLHTRSLCAVFASQLESVSYQWVKVHRSEVERYVSRRVRGV